LGPKDFLLSALYQVVANAIEELHENQPDGSVWLHAHGMVMMLRSCICKYQNWQWMFAL